MTQTWADFGGFSAGEPRGVRRISDLPVLQAAMRDCAGRRHRMRARCFGHSMNGMAAPRPDEILLDLAGARAVRWNGGGSVTAGAGLSVWELDRYVRGFGWKLPVINDGGAAAPSLGGFAAAGGIGEGCLFHGGFWETVSALTVVGVDGDARTIGRDDPLFAWMFGSLGTLGVVFDVTLDLVQATASRPRAIADSPSLEPLPAFDWPPHLWLTLFVDEARRDEAIAGLADLAERHPGVWTTRGAYEYFMLFRRFSPPMVFGADVDFVALGIWGDRNPEDADLSAYLALEADFQALVETRGYRRYFQSELIRARRGLEHYVGETVAARYKALKDIADPLGLLNSFMPA